MKKLKLLIFTIITALSLSGLALSVYADSACDVAGVDDPLLCPSDGRDEETELQGRVRDTLNVVYLWIGIIAVIVVVIGGVKYTTSAGNPEKIRGAKNTIMYSVVGLVVTLMAFAITNLTINAIDGNAPGDTVVAPATPGKRDDVKGISMISATQMVVGDTATLRAKVIPDYAKDKTITWSTSNAEVVSVSSAGEITAKKNGDAVITAKTKNGVKAETKVTVRKPVEVESIRLSQSSVKVNKGKTVTIKATISPANAANKTLTWKSADKKIATVNDTGTITGVKVGKTKVTVKTNNGKNASVEVVVEDPNAEEAIKVTDDLIKHLDSHYNQINYLDKTVSCLGSGYSSIGGQSCGLSTYLAARYVFMRNDISYMPFSEESCSTGFFNGVGASWDVVAHSKKAFYEKKYGITGKKIDNTWSSYVAELKKGHPIAVLVHNTICGFRVCTHYGSHFFLLLSYRENNGGEIYVWNPTNVNQGWHGQSMITQHVINVMWPGTDLPWAMWKK